VRGDDPAVGRYVSLLQVLDEAGLPDDAVAAASALEAIEGDKEYEMKCKHILRVGTMTPTPRGRQPEYVSLGCISEADGNDGLCPVHRMLERGVPIPIKPKRSKPKPSQPKFWSDDDASRHE